MLINKQLQFLRLMVKMNFPIIRGQFAPNSVFAIHQALYTFHQ